MYNDEENFYHYTYRKADSADSSQNYGTWGQEPQHYSGPEQPVHNMKPAGSSRLGLKITALALSCALLGGAAGGGLGYYFASRTPGAATQTSVNVSGRRPNTVSLKTVDGQNLMTDAEVYAANVDCVVSINTKGTQGYNFFGQPVQTASSGSGFVLTKDGYIATNYHVVENADTVSVTMYNGDTYDARFVGGDEDYDIAVIKIEAEDLQTVTIGDSSKLNVGDHVLAIGNPLGELTFSMSGGMVSSVNRAINVSGTPFNMIQTDTSINPGNSGGPLVNSYGEVVGIVSAKYSQSAGAAVEGLGFAIPINDVMSMIEDIMTNGYITNKPYLGITGGSMTSQMAAQYRYDVTNGVFVYSVEKGYAAEKAGLQMGDVITGINDTDIDSMEALTAAKKKFSAGDTVTITYYRSNEKQTCQLTFDAVPEEQKDNSSKEQQNDRNQGQQNPYGYGYGFNDPFNFFFGNRGFGFGG